MAKPTWTFLTNHAEVLLCVTSNPRITARDIASAVGITERAVQRIIDNLAAAGYVHRHREGRNNHYDVDLDQPLRHPAQRAKPVRDLVEVLLRYYGPPVADPSAPTGTSTESGTDGAEEGEAAE